MEELQAHMQQLTLEPEEFIEQLPPNTKVAVEALMTLQSEHDLLEEEYEKERAALEAKYDQLYAPLYDKRSKVISGETAVPGTDPADPAKGIPNFWQTVFLRCDATRDAMNEKDVDVLRYLVDVTAETLQPVPKAKKEAGTAAAGEGEEEEDEDEEATGGFRIRMVFSENPYFTNTVLEKTYYMLEGRDAVLERSQGTEIDWKAGKNVTMKLMKKKPKKGAKPDAKPQTKMEPVDSFFNFFNPPQVPDEDTELDPDEVEMLEAAIEADYDIGDTIKHSLIPNAVGWFTGTALEEEEGGMYLDEDEDEDEDEDDDDEDEDDEDDSPPRPRRRGGKRAPGAAGAASGEQPQECKQQ